MKKKLILTVSAVLAIALVLCGCSQLSELVDELKGSAGPQEGTINQKMPTYFFDFTVLSAETAYNYADYTPAGGNQLVVVRIKTTNTFDSAIPMLDYDYQLQWGDRNDAADDDKYADVLDMINDDCAPSQKSLPSGDSMTYDYVYEVPAEVAGFEICYLEAFDDDTTGSIHYVKLDI